MNPPTTQNVATKLANKVFEQRGNNSEVHLSRTELTAVLQVACELTLELSRATDHRCTKCGELHLFTDDVCKGTGRQP